MERDKLPQSNIATYCLSLISKARVVLLAGGLAKRLTSMLLMLVFTVSAFVVLVVSVVLLTAESLVRAILSQVKAPTEGSLQELLKGDRFSPSQFSQTK
jgi:hypothetical protein